MRTTASFLALGCLLALAAGELRIVATTSDLADIARAVAGPQAEVTSIATGKQDPHYLDARPSFIVRARQADVWIRVGLELELGWEPAVLDGARNRRIQVGAPGHIDVSADILRLDVPTGPVDRALGDVHPHGNPHYWLDPLNGRLAAAMIARRLTALAPDRQDEIAANLARFQADLDTRMFGADLVAKLGGPRLWQLLLDGKLDETLATQTPPVAPGGWYGQLRPWRGAKLITYHRSWIYLTGRFGLTVAAELEPKPGVPPSPKHLETVIALAQREQIKVLLIEPFYERKAADLVASRTGAKVLVAANSVGGDAAATSYLTMLDAVIGRLAVTLGAK